MTSHGGQAAELPETRAMRTDAVTTTHMRDHVTEMCLGCALGGRVEMWPCELVLGATWQTAVATLRRS